MERDILEDMTDNDLRLIEQAEDIRKFEYYKVDELIDKADTARARERLRRIRWELYDLVLETL